MAIDWRMGVMPDVGMNAMAAFQKGRQIKEQRDAKEAMAAYAVNPNESGLNALAQYDPKFVVETKQAQANTAKADQSAELTKRVDLIGQVAQWADSPEKWDAGVDYLASLYPDLASYKGKFTPESRMAAIAAAGEMKEHLAGQKPVLMGPGYEMRNPSDGSLIAKTPFAPWRQTLGPGQTLVGGQDNGTTGFPGGFDAFHSGFLSAAEGGFNPKDPMSGAPVNFGIDQRANPDIDVKNLTPDAARQLMHDRYWVPSGADQIENPALQAVHADTAINMGVGAAKGLLEKSGGDPAKYLQLREQRYREIGGPALEGWLNRNRKLAEFTGLGGGQVAAPAGGPRVLATGAPKPQGRVVTNPPNLPAGTYWITPDGKPEPISPPKAAGQGGKAIPASVENKVTEQFDIYSSLQRSADNWKPDFGGNTMLGEAENIAQRMFGTGTPGQAEWWADFQTTDNLIRNSMFGAALTATEKAAYEKTTVSPRMDPATVTTRVAKRRDIIRAALQRRARTLAAQGYNPEAISAMFGDDPALIGGVVNASPPAPQQRQQSPTSSGGWGTMKVRP